jgi:hypothetical protein
MGMPKNKISSRIGFKIVELKILIGISNNISLWKLTDGKSCVNTLINIVIP